MFAVLHSGFQQAGSFRQLAKYRLPPMQRRDLERPGSLSSRMQQWCVGSLPVTVLRQGVSLPTRDEARLLGLGLREQVWVREVHLGPYHEPWVKGRTVVPLRDMHGLVRGLRNLGNRPLGSVLFSNHAGRLSGHNWRRSPFLLGQMVDSGLPGLLPARRSVFYHRDSRLLVTEGFYPAYWQRLQQEPQAPMCISGSPAPVDLVPGIYSTAETS